MRAPKRLLEAAYSVADNSYAPYSGFRVASAVLDDRGRIFTGVNVENSSYGLTICAERAAIFNAVTHGARRIREVLVYARDSEEPVPPCGACLQVIAEFGGPDTVIHMVSGSGAYRKAKLSDLLTTPFRWGRSEE